MKTQILKLDKLSNVLKKRLDDAEKDIEAGNYKSFSTVDEFMVEITRPRPWQTRLKWRMERYYEDWVSPSTWYYRCRRFYLWFFKWGFDPYDIWSLDYSTAKWILPRLKKLKEIKSGVPVVMFDNRELFKAYVAEHGLIYYSEEDRAEVLWEFVLDKMIEGFELTIEDDWGKSGGYIQHCEKIQECMGYFVKYFYCLWD